MAPLRFTFPTFNVYVFFIIIIIIRVYVYYADPYKYPVFRHPNVCDLLDTGTGVDVTNWKIWCFGGPITFAKNISGRQWCITEEFPAWKSSNVFGNLTNPPFLELFNDKKKRKDIELIFIFFFFLSNSYADTWRVILRLKLRYSVLQISRRLLLNTSVYFENYLL